MINDASEDPQTAPLSAHLGELRGRLLRVVLAWLGTAVLAYMFAQDIYGVLLAPLAAAGADHPLIYTNLSEAFVTYLRLAFWAGAFVGVPFLLTEIWGFTSPGLTEEERKRTWPLLMAFPVLFSAGAAFVYFAVLPIVLPFFLGFEANADESPLPIILQARVGAYLDFALGLMLAFGIVFQLPLILILAVRMRFIKRSTLTVGRRYAIIAAFVVGAILTPPDVMSQVLLASVIIILYESTLFFIPHDEVSAE